MNTPVLDDTSTDNEGIHHHTRGRVTIDDDGPFEALCGYVGMRKRNPLQYPCCEACNALLNKPCFTDVFGSGS